jgi:hypothetical protein
MLPDASSISNSIAKKSPPIMTFELPLTLEAWGYYDKSAHSTVYGLPLVLIYLGIHQTPKPMWNSGTILSFFCWRKLHCPTITM